MLCSNASKETAPHEMASFMTFQGCLHGLHDSLWPDFPYSGQKLLNVIYSAIFADHTFFHAVLDDILGRGFRILFWEENLLFVFFNCQTERKKNILDQ